jgi:hypothetical protein
LAAVTTALCAKPEHTAELQKRCRIRHPLAAKVAAHEATQRRAVQQRVFAGPIGQVEPVLHQIHPKHALQAHRRATVARLWVVRLDHLAQRGPRHDLLHRRQEGVAPGRAAVQLILRVVVGGHGKGLLLHA